MLLLESKVSSEDRNFPLRVLDPGRSKSLGGVLHRGSGKQGKVFGQQARSGTVLKKFYHLGPKDPVVTAASSKEKFYEIVR